MTTVYISFTADINLTTTEQLLGASLDQVNRGAKHIYYLFSTPGGFVANGITIYNTLKGLPVDITMHNVGAVDSIGNAVFLAGTKRFACFNATFMFHGVGFTSIGGQHFEEKDIRERLDGILADQRKIGSVITKETSLIGEEVDGLFRESQTKDVDFALAKGLIHEIREVTIPAGAPLIQLAFQR